MKKLLLVSIFIISGLTITTGADLSEISEIVFRSLKAKSADVELKKLYPTAEQLQQYIESDEFFYAPEGFDINKPAESINDLTTVNINRFYEQYDKYINFGELAFIESDYDELYRDRKEIHLNIWVKDPDDHYLIRVDGIKELDGNLIIPGGLSFSLFESIDDKTKVTRDIFRLIHSGKKEDIYSHFPNKEDYKAIDEKLLISFEKYAERFSASGKDMSPYKKSLYEDNLPPENIDSVQAVLKAALDTLYQDPEKTGINISDLRYYATPSFSRSSMGEGKDKITIYSKLIIAAEKNRNLRFFSVSDVYVFNDKWVITGNIKWQGERDKRVNSFISKGSGTKEDPFIIDGEGIFITPQPPAETDTSYYLLKGFQADQEVTLKHKFSMEGEYYTDPEYTQISGTFFSSSSYYRMPEETNLFEYTSPSNPQNFYIKLVKDIDKDNEESAYLPPVEFIVKENKEE